MRVVNQGDPGRIPRDSDLDEYLAHAEPAKLVIINGTKIVQRWCPYCRIYKPPRSRHCYECNACIRDYDHHCPWLSNCIGNDNYKLFVFLFAYGLAMLCYSLDTILVIITDLYPQIIDIFDAKFYHFLIYKKTTLFSIFLLYGIVSTICALYFLMRIYLIVSNVTGHEFLTCAYPNYNPFNKGIYKNVSEFLQKPLFPSRLC
ncbi:zinc finger protein DHHC domain containing protein [Theileria equi strain WA]|uniref:Palmitoyltransferase n=1 Tax=Theileria equi strain WA TaxID=1537102 RepID=L0AZ06_THEEQ|nr:zinc finger protein DHHC domain containing protein [Theileria equi strain WA]AFZ80251.1 zinc finger protein DHHC domain containing protein [Theileria equi strain WA]|eukprot:XP_004829917.1 zinc finger protein DHHC domain containing protein [Theileria equi strain WA]